MAFEVSYQAALAAGLSASALVAEEFSPQSRGPVSWLARHRKPLAFPSRGGQWHMSGSSALTVAGPCWIFTSFPILRLRAT